MRLSGKPTLTVTPASSGVAMFTLASLSQSIDCCNPTPPVGSVFCNLGGGSVCVVAGQIAAAKSLPEYRQAQLEQRQYIEKATRAPVHAGFQSPRCRPPSGCRKTRLIGDGYSRSPLGLKLRQRLQPSSNCRSSPVAPAPCRLSRRYRKHIACTLRSSPRSRASGARSAPSCLFPAPSFVISIW